MLLGVGLGLSRPATAAFTEPEAASVAQLREALRLLNEGQREISLAIQTSAPLDPRASLALAASTAAEAFRDGHRALGLLVGVVTEQRGTRAYSRLAAKSRAERVATAWFYADRLVTGTSAAVAALATTSSANAIRARDIWWPQVADAAKLVDRTLGYAAPEPASYPAIIGPHGNYDEAQWYLWRAAWYALDGTQDFLNAYSLGGGDLERYHKALNSGTLLLDILAGAGVLNAGVAIAPEYVGMDPFGRTLELLALLTDKARLSVSQRLFEVLSNLNGMANVPSSAVASMDSAKLRFADSWLHMDQAVWEHVVFPGCPPECVGGTGQ
jgi:hypothetical protein